MTTLRFGRWRGHSINEIEIEYVLWLLSQRWFSARYGELYPAARRRAIEHFAAEVRREAEHRAGLDLV